MENYIDIYCERIEPGVFAEPLNALSNLAFFVASCAAYRLADRRNVLGMQTGFLLFILVMIGTGSTLFHTLATGWAQLADVLPILFFQIGFLLLYSRHVIRLDWTRTLILLLVFGACVRYFGGLPEEILNGSLGYAPALIFLGGFGVYHWRTNKEAPGVLLLATLTFIVSLAFRSIDMAVCDVLPIGVHYLWHMLNACVLYLCLRGLFVNLKKSV